MLNRAVHKLATKHVFFLKM